uniref:Mitochondrial ribosomal protein S22 n=1 Tax=Timema genevievae TaxID=629358 RepID=A0A7R9JX54_TIMGE|nr:unnamed protein product [Timema genevievae]
MASVRSKLCKYLTSISCRNCNILFSTNLKSFKNLRYVSSSTKPDDDRDPAPSFFNQDVQQLLKKLTRIDLKKVYRKKKEEQSLESPEYKFLTDEQLNKLLKEFEDKANEKLQMPPVVKMRKDEQKVLDIEPALQGYSDAKFVFTDITYGLSNKERLVVVRDPDGTLREASMQEHCRISQLYVPMLGRQLTPPPMFQEEYLKLLMEQGEYEFLLDRACVQFEPDDPEYHRVTQATYDHIDNCCKYETLRSTRHFGPFAFYLAWHKQIDNLVLESIHTDRLDEAVALIQLYHILNPESKSASVAYSGQQVQFVQAYVESDANKKSMLELALQTFMELQKQRQEVEEGIQKAHLCQV